MKASNILLAAVALTFVGVSSAAAQGDTAKKATPVAAAKAPAKATTKAPAPKFSVADIKAAQEGLAKEKFYTATPSGRLDRTTTAAIRKYQQAHNLKVTGQLSDSLLAALKAAQ